MKLLVALGVFAIALPAHAATLRPFGTLAGGVVRVSDLFDGAGGIADRVLGPGPGPGGRIVVEAPQLAAIARQFGVDWRPASPSDRAVLDRPGRALPREEVLAPLRAALTSAGAPEGDIDLPGFTTPIVPQDGEAHAMVEQIDYDSGSGRFTAMVAVDAQGMPSQHLRLSGTVQEMVELPVPTHRLLPGIPLRAEDFAMGRVRASLVRGEVVRSPAQAIGLAPRRQAVAGQPLLLADLTKPLAVGGGDRVAMELISGGLTLTALGQAMEGGALGGRIQVLNPASRAVVEADVIAPGRVRVAPGTVAMLPPGATRLSSNAAARSTMP